MTLGHEDYASLIRETRKRMRLNAREFGSLIGVSGRTVENWEQGRRNPSKSALLLIKMMQQEDVKNVDDKI